MKIVNSMFASGLGGIEQAFIDYTKALLLKNYQVVCLIRKNAQIKQALIEEGIYDKNNIRIYEIENIFGKNDLLSISKIKKIFSTEKPDIAISHGNRAISLVSPACKASKARHIAVAHNYNIKHMSKADYVFTITDDLKNKISDLGFDKEKIYKTPNMIDISQYNIK
jgi:UDP-N-acetylglucosamine 2-epimerase